MGADRYLILTAFVGGMTRKVRQNAVTLTVGAALAVGALAVAALLAALTAAWMPDGGASGSVTQSARETVAGSAGSNVALMPAQSDLPRPADPGTSMGLMPASSTADPDEPEALPAEPAEQDALADGETSEPWAFPFDQPVAPEEDDNQALAVNTTDGSVDYSAEFALVWAEDGEPVATRNEAYALASCTGCTAVAVGFQVVLIEDPTEVIAPQNHSAAVNYNCLECNTHALASQLVLAVDCGLSDDAMEQLSALWDEIDEYGSNLEDVPLSEIQGRLEAYKGQIIAVVQANPSTAEDSTDGVR
jgi:putative peptide zinc metalloprotease protein